MTPHAYAFAALCAGAVLGLLVSLAIPADAPAPVTTTTIVTRTVPVEVEVSVTDPVDCALLAMARIASTEGATVGRGRWHVARTAGELAETCEEATALVALSRQESTWTPSAVSHAGACGVTQVRSCDAEGTFPDGMPCCDTYRQGGHHCRPRCEWLADPANAMGWTLAWLRDRGGWDPHRYVGARDPEVGAGYAERAETWLRMAQGGERE